MFAGVSKRTFQRWRVRWETAKAGTPLAELRDRVRQAEGLAAVNWLALINKAAAVDWKAAGWLLAHRYPEQYGGSFQKVALTAPDGQGPPRLEVVYLPSKSPDAAQWQEDVAALRQRTIGAVNGAS